MFLLETRVLGLLKCAGLRIHLDTGRAKIKWLESIIGRHDKEVGWGRRSWENRAGLGRKRNRVKERRAVHFNGNIIKWLRIMLVSSHAPSDISPMGGFGAFYFEGIASGANPENHNRLEHPIRDFTGALNFI